MLECRGLAVSYGRHQALKGVDLHVAPGEIVVILGANGAGKTTLLKAIAGLVPAEAPSRVLLDGKPILNLPAHRIVEAGLALVPEGRGIFADLSVRENLLLGAFAQRARAQQQTQLGRLLNLFPKLAERSAQQARTMSGGEQQMVAIGRALMSSPTILMLDEPSLGLSPLLCTELFKALAEVRESGVGILLVEQNARQSLAIADRAYLLENGHVVGEGSADQLARDPAVQAAYLGGAAASPAPRSAPTAAGAPHPGTRAVASPGPSRDVLPIVAPSALPEAVSAALAAARASLSPLRPARSVPPEALIPERIDELVRHAAQVQARHVDAMRAARPMPQAADRERSAAPAHDDGPASAGAAPPASLAEALARIEKAAANARLPKAAAPAMAPAASAGHHTPLPTIDVWRRPKIEIWRRSGDGTLKRGE
jgi:branched-chain amino acid transport system ATP-binding protein